MGSSIMVDENMKARAMIKAAGVYPNFDINGGASSSFLRVRFLV